MSSGSDSGNSGNPASDRTTRDSAGFPSATPALDSLTGRTPESEPSSDSFEELPTVQPQPREPAQRRAAKAEVVLTRIGRYQVVRVLGVGGFGRVYLGFDDQLDRQVAIKVPRNNLSARTLAEYAAEAKIIAHLEHPHIVPVYDIGPPDACPFYFVTRYVEGTDLARWLKRERMGLVDSVQLLVTVADAVHYAHQHGVVHRDIKPGNILLDTAQQPYVSDFGLALRENKEGHSSPFVGTVPYMSPEQARGEGHRVDGRSDIFSLGVVLYELLVGQRPFKGENNSELLSQIINYDPRPPRQFNEKIPRELERICLKALAKRAADRYSTAHDMAEDLRLSLHQLPAQGSAIGSTYTIKADINGAPPSQPLSAKIVPKGLRAFDAHDANFFLEMIPGPRDRDGIPESIRFWKSRLEDRQGVECFPVGLICGPSGCGKSSFVKAGVLPLLSGVQSIYIECTPHETESRLKHRLKSLMPQLNEHASLPTMLMELRRCAHDDSSAPNHKVVIVLDQFEQWLQATAAQSTPELTTALRQCDGANLQCLILVRDDFWMATLRFMRELECSLIDGENSQGMDLFPLRHAEKVLLAFGQAYGTLPPNADDLTSEHKRFLSQAVEGLRQEDKVIPVRLALFAEMMKSHDWTPRALKMVGGAQGVGLSFLDAAFDSSTAPAEHRYHSNAARNVLALLMPDPGVDIKGQMRSRTELLAASGYRERPRDFHDLIRILERQLRIITLTDPRGKESLESASSNDSSWSANSVEEYYELAHDYLVHSLREWLTRKQRETRRGRTEILLQERTSLWSARRDDRLLPSLTEWCTILWHTAPKDWSSTQAQMMQAASRYHRKKLSAQCLVGCFALAVMIAIAVFISGKQREAQVESLVKEVLGSRIELVPDALKKLNAHDPKHWQPRIREAATSSEPTRHLRALWALLPFDPNGLGELTEHLLNCSHEEATVLRQELRPWHAQITEDVWRKVSAHQLDREQALRAASLLSIYAPRAEQWRQHRTYLAENIVNCDAISLQAWTGDLQAVSRQLMLPLKLICLKSESSDSRRVIAASLIAEFVRTDATSVAAGELLELSTCPHQAVRDQILPALMARREDLLPLLANLASHSLNDISETDSNRAVAAIRVAQYLGHDELFWQHLSDLEFPQLRTGLITSFGPMPVAWQTIRQRFDIVPPVARQALLLGIAEQLTSMSDIQRAELQTYLVALLHKAPEACVHSAAEYTLRKLDPAAVESITEQMASGAIDPELPDAGGSARNWSILPNKLCLIELTPPAGKTPTQSFEISNSEVTVEQFQEFQSGSAPSSVATQSRDCPMNNVTLFDAMRFCRWLSQKEPDFDGENCAYPPISEIGPDMTLPTGFERKPGFRLPFLEEWQYAAHGDCKADRFFGKSVADLYHYARFSYNSEERVWPVKTKRPNPLGLFDVYGNTIEWIHQSETIGNVRGHAFTGGSYRTPPRLITEVVADESSKVYSFCGFRVVRIR